MRRTLALIALVALLLAVPLHAKDASEIRLALKKLTVVGSALHIAAHPDDENTALLSWLANEKLVRTAYLSMTRGDGGQNLIGDEKGELLGVIRTQELLAARRIDGAEQYFTRAIDFGFTKSAKEALEIWGHDTILADTVWVIRQYQPDIVIARFPTTGEGGHGQHTASAILAGEAFAAAGDPSKFPEQLRYVHPWQPTRLLWNRFSRQELKPEDVKGEIPVDLGAYNPLLGRAYTELAAQSRNMHKSQGFGVAAERRGSSMNYFRVLAGEPATKDLFEGVNLTWSRYPGGEPVGKLLQQAHDQFDEKDPAKSIPLLMQAVDMLNTAGASAAWAPEQNPWIAIKRQELYDVIRACAGMAIDVSASASSVVPGAEIPVTVTVVNRSDYPFSLAAVASPYANPGKAPGTRLENNVPVRTEVSIRVPADYPYSQPYWLARPAQRGAFTVDDQRLIGLAENNPPVPLTVSIDDATHMRALIFTVPLVFRSTDAVRGEQLRRVDVVPEATATLGGGGVYLFPDEKARPVSVAVRDFNDNKTATVRLQLPQGWSAQPASIPVTFDGRGDEKRVTFNVTPPKQETTGTVTAEVELANGKKVSMGLIEIEYPHIPAQRIFNGSSGKLVRADVKKVGNRIGYIMGAGDDIPVSLRQIGYDVVLLSDEDLERGDFSKFDAVVTGVRAYNARKAMKLAHAKLMRYVENGGTLVVQYNSLFPQPLLVSQPGPYPFKVTDQRVTVEEAPVKILAPQHPLLTAPNRITAGDFSGWVQERGLYFTDAWDPKYTTILASNDPGEPERAGGELYARYGKGVFIYTSYAWFRQLPAGVPGAYKLFANLVSAR